MKASERPLGGFGALPPVNAYAPGMRRATQNGPAEKTKKQSKKTKQTKAKENTRKQTRKKASEDKRKQKEQQRFRRTCCCWSGFGHISVDIVVFHCVFLYFALRVQPPTNLPRPQLSREGARTGQ